MFVFPSSKGRLDVPDNPAGKIRIGDTITVAFALKILRIGSARFVGLDASKLTQRTVSKIAIRVTLEPSTKLFGFIVKDSRQSVLNISIDPKFMSEAKRKSDWQGNIAREGNLEITLAPVPGGYKILKVLLD